MRFSRFSHSSQGGSLEIVKRASAGVIQGVIQREKSQQRQSCDIEKKKKRSSPLIVWPVSPLTSYPNKALSELRLRHAEEPEEAKGKKNKPSSKREYTAISMMGKEQKMLRKIYGFLGLKSATTRRHKLVCRLWYVHNKDLSEAFQSDFYETIVEAKRATAMVRDEDR